MVYKKFNFLLGGRVDNYNGISRRSMVQPRLGVTYDVSGGRTRCCGVGYGKLFLTPYNENLIVSSSTGVGGLEGAGFATPLKPASRTPVRRGL